MLYGSVARQILERLVDELSDDGGAPLSTLPDGPDGLERRLAAFRQVLDSLPGEFDRLRESVERDRDLEHLQESVRIKALYDYCRVSLGVIDQDRDGMAAVMTRLKGSRATRH
ncbi:MAG: hypothetical protein KDE22_13030 [Rhodobacterales bacterium]|nr:hypothetical protein [Rhodobacterales bacterium]